MTMRKVTMPDDHLTQTRIDGWLGSDPQNIPPAIGEIIAGNIPPLDNDTVADIRQRMLRRQREYERRARHG